MWSRESTVTPVTEPRAQCFSGGNGCGHSGSTSSRGTWPVAPRCARTIPSLSDEAAIAADITAAAAQPKRLRFISFLQMGGNLAADLADYTDLISVIGEIRG